MRSRAVEVSGAAEVAADFTKASKTSVLRASRVIVTTGRAALGAAKRSVPVQYGATRRSLVLTATGSLDRAVTGDLDVEVGAVARPPGGGLSAAGWLTFGGSRTGPQWDFFGEVEPFTARLEYDLSKIAGDV